MSSSGGGGDGGGEGWIESALQDDVMVAHLLMRLSRDTASPPVTTAATPLTPLVGWTVRQARSKSVPKVDDAKKDSVGPPTRSPNTPLTWSGGCDTSLSGGATDGFDGGARSKVTARGEASTSKRSKKKKTLLELKEEENMMLKETISLKRELAQVRATLEEGRAINESLKKRKMELLSQPSTRRVSSPITSKLEVPYKCQKPEEATTVCNQPQKMEAATMLPNADSSAAQNPPQPNFLAQPEQVIKKDKQFLLPDLNMPAEEDFEPDTLYGMS